MCATARLSMWSMLRSTRWEEMLLMCLFPSSTQLNNGAGAEDSDSGEFYKPKRKRKHLLRRTGKILAISDSSQQRSQENKGCTRSDARMIQHTMWLLQRNEFFFVTLRSFLKSVMSENTKLQKHGFVWSLASVYLWLCFHKSTCPRYGDWKPATGAATGSSVMARTVVTNTKRKDLYSRCR